MTSWLSCWPPLLGFITVVVLSLGTDQLLHSGRVYPPWGQPMSNALFVLAAAYRTVYTVAGGYVTHGETYYNDSETLWWAKGGKLTGESVPRIAFLRRILEAGPDEGLEPLKSTGAYRITTAGGLDNIVLQQLFTPPAGEEGWPGVMAWWPTAGQLHKYYLSYFGENRPREVVAAVPPDEMYDAVLIDTWEMTQTPLAKGVVRGHVLRIAPRPYQALLLTRAD